MRHPYPDAPSPETRRARWIRRTIVAIQTLIFLWALLTQVIGGNGDSDNNEHIQPPSEDRAADVQHVPAMSVSIPVDDIQQIPSLYLVDTAVQVSEAPAEQSLSGQPDEGRQYTQSPYAVPMTGCGGAE